MMLTTPHLVTRSVLFLGNHRTGNRIPSFSPLVLDVLRALEEPRGHQVVAGPIVSGDQFIAQAEKVAWLRATFGASAVEMEGAALAQAANRLGVPFAVVRILSDSADGDAVADFPAFLNNAAHRGRDLAHALARQHRPHGLTRLSGSYEQGPWGYTGPHCRHCADGVSINFRQDRAGTRHDEGLFATSRGARGDGRADVG